MNKPDSFVMVVALMSEKMVEQTTRIAELEDHITRDHAHMDDMQRTITDLREQVEGFSHLREANDRQRRTISDLSYKVDHYDVMKRENERLYAEVRQLKLDNYKRLYGGQTPEELANNYMEAEGAEVYNRAYVSPDVISGKIACIKVVREMTGWGLKETKDFVEAYMAALVERQERTTDIFLKGGNGEESNGPSTQRSSQSPNVGSGEKPIQVVSENLPPSGMVQSDPFPAPPRLPDFGDIASSFG